MQRYVAIDIESSGFGPKHELIALAAVEFIGNTPSGRCFQFQCKPDNPQDPQAHLVHGMSDSYLGRMESFSHYGHGFADFLRDAIVLCWHLEFDLPFVNRALQTAGLEPLDKWATQIVDVHGMAAKKWPNQELGMDTLCEVLDLAEGPSTLFASAALYGEIYHLLDSKVDA